VSASEPSAIRDLTVVNSPSPKRLERPVPSRGRRRLPSLQKVWDPGFDVLPANALDLRGHPAISRKT
jgi:hypothetical protein